MYSTGVRLGPTSTQYPYSYLSLENATLSSLSSGARSLNFLLGTTVHASAVISSSSVASLTGVWQRSGHPLLGVHGCGFHFDFAKGVTLQ